MALVLLSNQLLADLPGGYNQFAATIRVYDQNGDPYPNIPLQLLVDTEGPWGPNICVKTGTTDGQGYSYLECQVDPNYSEQLNFMQVTITVGHYAIIESENTTTTTQSFIFPVFDIGYDANYNDVVDGWEMPLAQKFCPVLFAPVEDRGLLFGVSNGVNTLRPVPAEIMDIDGPNGVPDGELTFHDVYVEVTNTNGQFVGEWEMEELTVGGLPYSSFYPERVHHNHKILNFTPPGKATGTYILHPHYPLIGTWIREVTVFQQDVEEYVVENGSISNETVQIDFNGYQNIMIIPPKSHILNNLIDDTDFNWLVFGGYWGHRTSEPTASIAGYNINNVAPLSPYGGDVGSNEIRY